MTFNRRWEPSICDHFSKKKKTVDWLCPLSEEDEARHGGACGTTCGIAIFQCFAPLCAVVVLPEDCEFVIAVQFTMLQKRVGDACFRWRCFCFTWLRPAGKEGVVRVDGHYLACERRVTLLSMVWLFRNSERAAVRPRRSCRAQGFVAHGSGPGTSW